MKLVLSELNKHLDGEVHLDKLTRHLYATDASVYRKVPLAVVLPKTEQDLTYLTHFAEQHRIGLIPRTAGTSLAGQCVGEGIVIDFSKHFTSILSFNEKQRTVTVQPGVVRDQLNNFLKPHGLFFGPNTSTSNRCMIGGMLGNNSSGTTSIKYGVTRDKVIGIKGVLSDGSVVEFKEGENFKQVVNSSSFKGLIYKGLESLLSTKQAKDEIEEGFPKPEIHRRNTGYALDELIKLAPFKEDGNTFNLAKLICGSEGTLMLVTEITLVLDQLPPKYQATIALHFSSIQQCLNSVSSLMKQDLYSCEMLDDTILNLTKHNKTQIENRRFIQGNPKAILLCELRADTKEQLDEQIDNVLDQIKKADTSYAFPVLKGEDIDKAMNLRKAGLGLLGNMIGDKKAVACIEDTAVTVDDLANYIEDFTKIMNSHNQNAVYYAHAGAGELHLRPILNLKSKDDVILFRTITTEVARLVKSYNGSMSGEHGDGIVRSEFISLMLGEENYKKIKAVKQLFDPHNIFNPGKIVDPWPMDENLRYQPKHKEIEVATIIDFSESQGILREAEKCNGSGDCRKLPEFGGTMCPSYRATRNEKDTTRARANALREFLTHSDKVNRFDHKELFDVFDLCLSCKACSSECPSSVNVAALKAEFEYQYQKANGVGLRTKAFAYNNTINQWLSPISKIVNWSYDNPLTNTVLKSFLGIAKERSLPKVSGVPLIKKYKSIADKYSNIKKLKTVYLFNDEFTNYLDTTIGEDAIELLGRLGYDVKIIKHEESGRALISKGLLEQAKRVAVKNVDLFKDLISESSPLIGIEPSAILTFKDEYIKLVSDQDSAQKIAKHTYLIEEFLSKEVQLGNIKPDQFTAESKSIKFHGHCHQKALSHQKYSFDVLNVPANYRVTIIPSGCCGMAGSFGYEKSKYEVSMSIGGQTLFPAVKKASNDTIIAANGTSCRHQIFDGTGRTAIHPVTILKEALL